MMDEKSSNEMTILKNESLENLSDINCSTSYTISLSSSHSIIIVHDFHIRMSFNVFMCGFISELKKTLIKKKIWCDKDSDIFNNYDCHFKTLKFIDESKCSILFLLDIKSLKRKHFINYLKMLKWKIKNENPSFTLISVFNKDIKNQMNRLEHSIDPELNEFICSEIFDKGLMMDFDSSSTVMFAVSNILPLIISKIYSPHQLSGMDLEEFYQMKTVEEPAVIPYNLKPMHLWLSCDLVDWLESMKYPQNLLVDLEDKQINGYIIQNATAEDLRDFLKITRPVLRQQLIEDVYSYLKFQDSKNDNCQFACLNVKSIPNQVLVIRDVSDDGEVDIVINLLMSDPKYHFQFDKLTSTEKANWKAQSQEIARSKVVIVFVSNRMLTRDENSFNFDVEKKIIFSIWLRKPVIFLLSGVNFARLNEAFKIIIEDQTILNIRTNPIESIGDCIAGLFIAINNQSNSSFAKCNIPAISEYEPYNPQINSSCPPLEMKKMIIIHYHSESLGKIDMMRMILEKKNYSVKIISVDKANHEFDRNQNLREKILLNSSIVISCVSTGYIHHYQTKTDLKLLCHLLQKKIVLVLVQRLHDLKLLPKIQKLILQSGKPNLKSKQNKNESISIIDLSDMNDFYSISSSKLLTEIKKIEQIFVDKI